MKKIIKQPRPVNNLKKTEGMPSSHATYLSFFSTFIIYHLYDNLKNQTSLTDYYITILQMISIITASNILIWFRVYKGIHTYAQVLVGYSIGTGMGLCWYKYLK